MFLISLLGKDSTGKDYFDYLDPDEKRGLNRWFMDYLTHSTDPVQGYFQGALNGDPVAQQALVTEVKPEIDRMYRTFKGTP